MTIRLLKRVLPGFGLCLALAAGGARAAQPALCTVTASPVIFGDYNPFGFQGPLTVGTIEYTCMSHPRGGLKILLSLRRRGPEGRRAMRGPQGQRLGYYLSLDPVGLQVWGDGTEGTQFFFDPNPPSGKPVMLRVYGHVPPRQMVRSGLYSDEVSVSAEF